MDVHCSTCGEPWDVYHLRHEAIFETDLTQEEAKAWLECSNELRLNARYREKFKAAGWEFGNSVVNVKHCPCCPRTAKLDSEKAEIKEALDEALGDDEDGLAATLEDFGL